MTRRAHAGAMLGGLTIALMTAGLAAAQAPAAKPAGPGAPVRALAGGGDVSRPLSIAPDELKSMPRARVEVKEDERTVVYEGVLVGELLKRGGAPLGGELRGNAVASYVLASAQDGYQVVFSLAELDAAFTGSEIIVADTIDGKPLFANQGPFRIVAPKDSRGARSIRLLERIDLVRLRK